MNAVQVSEIDILEWIGKLGTAGTANESAKQKLMDAGSYALPWLVRSYNGSQESNSAITEVVREITSRDGIPRQGARAIRRLLQSV